MITLNKAPQLYTTLNLASFQITSDRPTILKFNVSVLDATTSAVLAVQSYGTLPMYVNGTSFDLAPLLASFVTNQMIDSLNLLEPTSKILRAYKLSIEERYIDGNGNVVLGDILTTDTYNIINANLGRVGFSTFDFRSLVAGAGLSTTRFLSKRPAISNLYYNTKEFLYFIANAAARVKLTFYAAGAGVAGVKYIDVPATNKGYRINVSPVAIQAFYGNDLLQFYGLEFSSVFTAPFGIQKSLADVNYFTVQLVSTVDDTPLSEARTYSLKADGCNRVPAHIVFANKLGGFDSAIFFEPRQAVTSVKTTIEKNPFQYDTTGNYTDQSNGVYNPDARIIASKTTNSFSLVSDALSDEYSSFYRSIYESDEVYIRLSSGVLYPIIIEQKSYNIGKRKYNTANNRLELTFSVEGVNFDL